MSIAIGDSIYHFRITELSSLQRPDEVSLTVV